MDADAAPGEADGEAAWEQATAQHPDLASWAEGGHGLRPAAVQDDIHPLGLLSSALLHPFDTFSSLATGAAVGLYTGTRQQWLAARDLGWAMRHSLEDMVRSAWEARSAH